MCFIYWENATRKISALHFFPKAFHLPARTHARVRDRPAFEARDRLVAPSRQGENG
jgi:hypothetical protein